MELKQYLLIAQRWVWFLLAGLLLGGLLGFAYSSTLQPVYQTATRVQVMSAPRSSGNEYMFWQEQQLAQTYVQTIKTRPVLDAVAERIGGSVSVGQVRTQTVATTQLIDIFVEDTDPQRAAMIANTLVDVFIQRNAAMQSTRFAESEESLQAQIKQVDEQIDTLQARSAAASSAASKETLAKTLAEIERLQKEILTLQSDLETLKAPARLPGALATPTASPDDRAQINEKELQLKQLQATYDLYQQIYTNLIVLGENRSGANTNTSANTEQEQMQSTLALYRQIRANLLSSYESIRLARLSSTSNIVSIEPALVPGSPVRPQPLNNIFAGAGLGFLLVAVVAFLVEYLDDTIKTAEQVTQALGLPVIGYIQELQGSPEKAYVAENPRSPAAEAFRTLRVNLDFASVDRPLKTLLVVSVHPSEGKTTVATNLAVTMAQGGKRVLLIDADMRRPRVHRVLEMTNRMGLSNLFRDNLSIQEVARAWKDKNLAVITSGALPPNPSDLLSSNRMAAILESAKQLADIVIVDAPPFLVSDASILASRLDGVLLVIRPGKTPMDAALGSLEQMQRAGANILGAVLNRIPRNRPHYYGAHRYYYHGYYGSDTGYYEETSANANGEASPPKQASRRGWANIFRKLPARVEEKDKSKQN